MAGSIETIRSLILDGAPGEDIAGVDLPEAVEAAFVRRDEQEMFEGISFEERDPRKSLHVEEVPLPPLGPNECRIAVMASAVNFNTVWTSIFQPVSTFAFLERFGREGDLSARHNLDYHVVGSDAAGVVLDTGPGVTRWKPGDRVTVHCNYVDMEGHEGHDDSMLDTRQRIWGFESNFGGMAQIAMVKSNQLMPKPRHMTWEEAACLGLVSSTSYRMLVSRNGAGMKQGDIVLIWGATGGLGGFACQYVLNGGGIPVGVVSSRDKVELLHEIGVEHVIDRKAEGYAFWDGDRQDMAEFRRFGKQIRSFVGEDPDIVFEHPGRQTFGASVFVAKKGGIVVTCASTSGYRHEYDNRYLWMNLKRIIGSHFANYKEAWEANRLAYLGHIHPILSKTYPLVESGEAAYQVHHNLHKGKLGILCLAPEEGLGVEDEDLRARHLDKINLFKRFSD
ncbi:MAG TPA: crotonyl-CoA carboxylase/reductase [Actinomycetota bacterium]|nr:crotonyl-CoA carboxylase/reductase [Actinomycetota bacterium]